VGRCVFRETRNTIHRSGAPFAGALRYLSCMEFRLGSILCLLLLSAALPARSTISDQTQAEHVPAEEAQVVLPQTEIVTPAQTKPENFVYVAATRSDQIGRIMAPVFVNGVGPFAFVVDTGASSSVIAPRVARRLLLVPDPDKAKLLRGITGSEVVPTVVVDSITAGGISLARSNLPVVEPRVFADADGIFGADAFARGCLHVNFERGRLTILDRGCPKVSQPWESTKARLQFGGLVIVEARVGRQRTLAIIDTGAERSLGNPALFATLKASKKERRETTQVYAATSQAVFGDLVMTPQVRVGGVSVGNLQVVYGDFEVFKIWGVQDQPAIVLGIDVLGMTDAIMIDYKRSMLHILPHGAGGGVTMRRRGIPSRLPHPGD
jgi:predicted aspartyl protease